LAMRQPYSRDISAVACASDKTPRCPPTLNQKHSSRCPYCPCCGLKTKVRNFSLTYGEIKYLEGWEMSGSLIRITNDSTFKSDIEYDKIFEISKNSGISVGGKLISSNIETGSIQFKFKYGINPTGIKVDIQFRREIDGGTEAVIKGRVGDSFDTMGTAKERARSVFNEIIKQLECISEGKSAVYANLESETKPHTNAPIIGDVGASHRGKSKTTTAVLALLLGGLGVHRFYLGTWGLGLVYLVVLVLGQLIDMPYLAAFLGICESIRFFIMKQPNFDATYNYTTIEAFTF